MKKFICFLAATLLIAAAASAPKPTALAKDGVLELNVMNWEDYIDSGDEDAGVKSVIEEFEDYYLERYGKEVVVNYSTQGTNENMYTELSVNKNHYDLVCPSEYMIQKMISEDMLEPLNRTTLNVDVYDQGVSPYISDLFKRITVGNKSLYDYACCYMWGTMGFVYNPEYVDAEDVKSWSAVWNEKYFNKCTIKDSVRDSYVLALGYVYQEELLGYAKEYKDGDITAAQYNEKITSVFDRVDYNSLSQARNELQILSDRLYGYEVDSGKKDMAAGKIWINFAWSGDAVYALDYAEDPEMVGTQTAELYYAVPEAGSNIFFDGWVMPKGADVELAQEFINFIQRPEIAIRNMYYIGYTTSIATDEIFEFIVGEEGYGYSEEDVYVEDGAYFMGEGEDKTEVFPVDLTYLFSHGGSDKKYVAYTDAPGRQFTTQYPDLETVTRCTVMRHLNDNEINELNAIWAEAKEGTGGTAGLYIAIGVTVGIMLVLVLLHMINKHSLFARHGIKGYEVVSKEDVIS